MAWPRLSLAHLYFLIPVVALTCYGALTPTPPSDFWWHMRIGQMILETGQIPRSNLFAWTLPESWPYVYTSWLAEIFNYGLYQIGGLELALLARNILLCATLTVVGLEARARTDSWRLAGLAAAVAGALSLNNMILRPQNWSWLPFVVTFFLLSRYADGRLRSGWLLALPALMLVWVNTHGVFILGLLMMGAFVFGEGARRLLCWPGALSWRKVGWLAGTTGLSGLATLINPSGIGLYGYLAFMANNQTQRYGPEWVAPSMTDPIGRFFFASILVLIVALAFTRRRPTPSDIVLVCGFLWLSWSMVRTVTWYGFLVGPILAQCIAPLGAHQSWRSREIPALNWLIAALLAGCLVATQPWLASRLPLPERARAQMLNPALAGPLVAADTPVRAVAYLKEHPGGQLFNTLSYGSYVIWALPETRVFIDSRVEMFPLQIVEDYVAISRGDRVDELMRQYGADRALVSLIDQPRLPAALERAGWRREYADETSEIWRAP